MRADIMIAVLRDQRNDAMDQAALQAAEKAELKTEIEELKANAKPGKRKARDK